jgi:hypothetical protein
MPGSKRCIKPVPEAPALLKIFFISPSYIWLSGM